MLKYTCNRYCLDSFKLSITKKVQYKIFLRIKTFINAPKLKDRHISKFPKVLPIYLFKERLKEKKEYKKEPIITLYKYVQKYM